MVKSITRHLLLTFCLCIICLFFGVYIWKITEDDDYVNLSISIYSFLFVSVSSMLDIIAIILRYAVAKRRESQELFYNFAGTINLCTGFICAVFMYKTSSLGDAIFLSILVFAIALYILIELYIRKIKE